MSDAALLHATSPRELLKPDEAKKRSDLASRKPYLAAKFARIAELEEQGGISPIIRLEKSYLCNFQCSHCCAEPYMDRHLQKVLGLKRDPRPQMTLDDIRRLSREADALGIARFVITGGEPLVMKDFDQVVEAIDPERHYVVTDTNGWFLDAAKAKHLKAIGVEKVQLSLDSFNAAEHDAFRNKPGSYQRVMRAIDASLEAGLNLILSTVLVRGRPFTREFEELCRFCTERGIGLYVSYAKPSGKGADHLEDFTITKADADRIRELEKRYKVFTHMTPSYGSFKGCITVKGIITVTSTLEVTPCPYIDFSLGNLRETSLAEILARGMRNPWLGPYRPDCLIGEDEEFMRRHVAETRKRVLLPVPWGEGFRDGQLLNDRENDPLPPQHFDATGRCVPHGVTAPVRRHPRGYFRVEQPRLDWGEMHQRLTVAFSAAPHPAVNASPLPDRQRFQEIGEALLVPLATDPNLSPLLLAPRVPFFLPAISTDDPGALLENYFLPRVEATFHTAFPEYEFYDHHRSPLAGRIHLAPETRAEAVAATLARTPIVGWFFPVLLDYSLAAMRERVATLPSSFALAGGFETAAALIAAPDLLMRSHGYAPLLWLAAWETDDPDEGYYFENYGYNLTFNRRKHFQTLSEYWNAGLILWSPLPEGAASSLRSSSSTSS
ncbi:MAG: radical SAM protein [Hydrogenophilus sp.]|nr:radical SAM protein [Hydrogenophilus sp.]